MATVSAKVFEHHKKTDGTYNVKICIHHKSDRRYLDTVHYVVKKQLTAKMKIKDSFVNDLVDEQLKSYRKVISELGEKLNFFTAESLREYLRDKDADVDFIKFCHLHIEQLKKENRSGTAGTHRTVRNSLIDYFKRDSVSITEVNSNMLVSYERFLRGKRTMIRIVTEDGQTKEKTIDGLSDSGLHNHMRDLRTLFHPLKYLQGLQQAFLAAGGVIRENTLVKEVVTTDGIHIAGDIRARAVIYATHMPPNISLFNFECAPYRSYVMAVKLKSGSYPDALIYDMQEPYHYVRTHIIDGQQLLLVGGLDHKTGHEDPEKAFADLEKYIRKYYNVSSVKYRWSSQYYVPVDGLPYIGRMPMAPDGIYCATGYNGNGMMLGSIAGKILSDLVRKRPNKYQDLFSPSRIKPVDSFMEFVKENADVAYHFVADRLGIHETDSLKRLQPGTGKVVEVDGEKIAAYRDEAGVIHALSPVCTHAACIVNWNGEEKSWDCPCHGARYDINGQVLTGPATQPLAVLSTETKSA